MDTSSIGRAIARAIYGDAAASGKTKEQLWLEYQAAMALAADARAACAGMVGDESSALQARDYIIELLHSGESMVDVAALLAEYDDEHEWCLSLVLQVLSRNKAAAWWLWTDLDWLRFEAALEGAERLTEYGWSRAFNVHRDTITSLEGMYGRKLPRGIAPSMEAKIVAFPIDMDANEVVEELRGQFPKIKLQSVHSARHRWQARQQALLAS